MSGKTLIKIMLDIVMTTLFVALINAHETGLAFHEVVGLSISALFASHILLNWSWVKNITKILFNGKLKTASKLKYALNMTLFLLITTIIVTGILISQVVFPSIGSSLGNKLLLSVHIWTSYLCLGLFGLHLVLHKHYLIESVRKILANLRESHVQKTFLRLGATTLILVVLYSRVISTATRNEDNQANLYGAQIASSSQTTTAIKGRDDSSNNQVYENNANDVGEAISLSNYLGNLHCTACPKHCSLLSPQCGRATPQIRTAKTKYQELYGTTS